MKKLIASMILILMLAIVMPVSAELGVGATFPLLGELLGGQKTTEVHAGITLPVATSSMPDGPDGATWQGGYITLPNNETGLFPEFQYLRVTPLILGVDEKDIRENRVEISGACKYDKTSDSIVINTSSALPGQNTLVYEQDQEASRKDTRVLVFRFAKRISKTDRAAMVFTVTDPIPFLENYCRVMEHKSFDTASDECRHIARVLYLNQEVKSFQLVSPELPYEVLVDAYWRGRQNIPAVGESAPAPKVEAPVPAPAPLVPPAPTKVEFTINVNTSSSGAVSVQVSDRIYQGTSVSLCLEPGNYQAKVKVGSRSTGWLPFKVYAGMEPVTITVN